MSATVGDLLAGQPDLVVTRGGEALPNALHLMVQHGYSQLPVIDDDHRPIGLVTADSIARALNNFDVAPSKLTVADAMDGRFKTCRRDLDLLDVLDDLMAAPALLVLGQPSGRLEGIITTYETTEYFRLRTQDLMLAQDIEEMLKGHLLASFEAPDGSVDQAALTSAILRTTRGAQKEFRATFFRCLSTYLKETHGGDPSSTAVDGACANRILDAQSGSEPRDFEELSLGEFILMFVSNDQWQKYGAAFSVEREAIQRLLDRVRSTRNDLSHLRLDISAQQREELRFCKEWLGRHGAALERLASSSVADPRPEASNTASTVTTSTPQVTEALPLDEEPQATDSRYSTLGNWLQSQSAEKVSLTFSRIEEIIGDSLPRSAREHRSWWANDSKSHVQSRIWLHAGWAVTALQHQAETVTFSRSTSRELAYRDFFTRLLHDIREHTTLAPNVDAARTSWLTLAPIPDIRPRVAYLNVAFTRTRQFRIELYIDTGHGGKNKEIFDHLHSHRNTMEASIGRTLSWERIDAKRASRIALYEDGAITDDEQTLSSLLVFARTYVDVFRTVMAQHVNAALSALGANGLGA